MDYDEELDDFDGGEDYDDDGVGAEGTSPLPPLLPSIETNVVNKYRV
jgi:hypothetical protein